MCNRFSDRFGGCRFTHAHTLSTLTICHSNRILWDLNHVDLIIRGDCVLLELEFTILLGSVADKTIIALMASEDAGNGMQELFLTHHLMIMVL